MMSSLTPATMDPVAAAQLTRVAAAIQRTPDPRRGRSEGGLVGVLPDAPAPEDLHGEATVRWRVDPGVSPLWGQAEGVEEPELAAWAYDLAARGWRAEDEGQRLDVVI